MVNIEVASEEEETSDEGLMVSARSDLKKMRTLSEYEECSAYESFEKSFEK